ncbi:MAG TPA: metalloregulator ArsR/SmtB family transcription factor [Longimicrobiaceae bacterium]|jgi:ArsR family transcriptional regulator|nr:metalloregulator ArsR/SmtB family transcription factor [Longimicrobiaceae bacterium]
MATHTAPDAAQVARWFHALSDETRVRIVRMLAGGERCVCDLTGALDAAQSRLSFHLKTLKTAGLVTDRKEGRWVYYSLNPDALDAISAFAAEVKPAEGWQGGGGCC